MLPTFYQAGTGNESIVLLEEFSSDVRSRTAKGGVFRAIRTSPKGDGKTFLGGGVKVFASEQKCHKNMLVRF